MTPNRDLKQLLALSSATLFIGLGLIGKFAQLYQQALI